MGYSHGYLFICLERVENLHMAQLMPLPLTVSCFCKIQIDFTFLLSPGRVAVKRVCVLLQLSQMAAEYVSSFASSNGECHTDEATSDGPIAGNRSCDIYAWGSNSSHQLAEGSQEKLTTPKLASTFSDVVEVHHHSVSTVLHSCGCYCYYYYYFTLGKDGV